jgi:hypothetical protein
MTGRIFEVDESVTATPPTSEPQKPVSPKMLGPSKRAIVIGTVVFLVVAIAIVAVIVLFRFSRRAVSYVQTVQNAAAPTVGTKLDLIGGRTSVVVIKGFGEGTEVSNRYGTFNLEPVEVKDAETGERALGVQIHIKPSGVVSVTQDASIDYDELDSVIRAIDSMSAMKHTATSFERFEARYVTRGLVRVTVFDDFKGINQAMLNAGAIPTGSQFVSMEELAKVRNSLVDSKAKLDRIQ